MRACSCPYSLSPAGNYTSAAARRNVPTSKSPLFLPPSTRLRTGLSLKGKEVLSLSYRENNPEERFCRNTALLVGSSSSERNRLLLLPDSLLFGKIVAPVVRKMRGGGHSLLDNFLLAFPKDYLMDFPLLCVVRINHHLEVDRRFRPQWKVRGVSLSE